MITTSDILNRLGRSRVSAALGVGLTAVGNAATDKSFPASWYLVISDLCHRDGIECPACLFRMRPSKRSPEQTGDGMNIPYLGVDNAPNDDPVNSGTLKAAKIAARSKVQAALRSGVLVRGACEVCGVPDGQAHHTDYSQPLAVVWLCQAHHLQMHHRERRASQTGTVSELFSILGRDRITREAGHGVQVLSRAAVDNLMPASWYPGIRDMCAAEGIVCPEYLFRWAAKRVKPTIQSGSAA